ncbi:Uncharacterised protein [Mycobacteroides abscessus subsp. abscessus]|nr:Uncharacterised protein [Mycobacteroides abscessus subsp. abscessus]
MGSGSSVITWLDGISSSPASSAVSARLSTCLSPKWYPSLANRTLGFNCARRLAAPSGA